MDKNIFIGLLVSLYGLSGVFIVLILFYFITKLMMALSRKLPEKNEENG